LNNKYGRNKLKTESSGKYIRNNKTSFRTKEKRNLNQKNHKTEMRARVVAKESINFGNNQ